MYKKYSYRIDELIKVQ